MLCALLVSLMCVTTTGCSKSVVGESDDEGDINTGVDSEVGDLLDDGRGAMDIDNSLVDTHFIAIVGVGTITAG